MDTFKLHLGPRDKQMVRSLGKLLDHIATRDGRAIVSPKPKVIIFPAAETALTAAVQLVRERVADLLA